MPTRGRLIFPRRDPTVNQRHRVLAFVLIWPRGSTSLSSYVPPSKIKKIQCYCRNNFSSSLASDFRDIFKSNRIAEKVNQNLSGCVPVDEKYGA